MTAFPALPEDWAPTRETLHAYAHAVGALPRAFVAPHPKWWHVSLKPTPQGFITDPMSRDGGGPVRVAMDLVAHMISLQSDAEAETAISMLDGATATSVGDRLVEAAADLGLAEEVNRDKYVNPDPRPYDPQAAAAYWKAASLAAETMETHRASVTGEVGLVQLWPHGFDLAVEWFGTRTESYEENGEMSEHPSQINFGFYPHGRAYFYSNPWPFDKEVLVDIPLPAGATWHTEGWEGSILYYDTIAGDPGGQDKLLSFARAVHDAAAPTLLI